VFEESRIDIVDIGSDEMDSILALLGPGRVGRRGERRWHMWSSLHDSIKGGMIRFNMADNLIAEAMWLRYGSDPRLVDGLRNTNGSPSIKYVEAYTHWIDCPYERVAPIVHWARRALPRHHFEWGGQSDRWFLWFKTAEALKQFEERWSSSASDIQEAPCDDLGRNDYVRHLRLQTSSQKTT
jgi:hypothetical protein